MNYKLRAESTTDVVNFIKTAHELLINFKLESAPLTPDVYFEFETDLSLDEIILILKEIEDSHVMYQTLNTLESFTGLRNYDLD